MTWKSPYFLLVVATALWGGNFVVGRVMVSETPPFTLALLRWSTALVLLAMLYGRNVWRYRLLFLSKWKTVLYLAIMGVASFNTLAYIAVQYTDSINAALMNSATPILIVAISYLSLRERLSLASSIGIVISMVGVLWIISRGSWNAIISFSFNKGDLWMVLAIICWALYSVGMKKFAGVIPLNELFTVKVALAVIILLPCSVIELIITKKSVDFTLGTVSGVFYLGIFASIIAFSSWNKAVSLIGPSRSANFLNLIALFSAIFATLFADEQVRLYHFIGCILILVGVYTTMKAEKIYMMLLDH